MKFRDALDKATKLTRETGYDHSVVKLDTGGFATRDWQASHGEPGITTTRVIRFKRLER